MLQLGHPEAPLKILCAVGFYVISQDADSQPWEDTA